MTDDSIAKKVIQGLGEIATETSKETLREGEKIVESVITAKELLGLEEKVMTDQEMAQKKAEDEKKKQEEMDKLRSQMGMGRPVEKEMGEIRSEYEQEEKQKEQQEIQEKQEQAEMINQQRVVEMPGNPKKSAAKHQGRGGRKKKSMPDQSQMSETSEFKKGVD